MTVYAVFACWGVDSWLVKIFDTQEKAKEWVESTHNSENFAIEEWEVE